MGRVFDYTVMPVLLPFIGLWVAAAKLLSLVLPLLLWPVAVMLNNRLEWALPFLPHIWKSCGWLTGGALRLGFRYAYAANVCR